MNLNKILTYWKNYRCFTKLPMQDKQLVFYSEGKATWVHLQPIIDWLLQSSQQTICYVSSTEDDPGLALQHPNLRSFIVGEGNIRTIFFNSLQANVVVMTTPDLNTFVLKRSPLTKHYAYIHHSPVSCHMVYRPKAFDHFDSIFCTGPHHNQEIRRMETTYQLKKKQLINHGYGYLDTILQTKNVQDKTTTCNEQITVLIAPSWGEHGILETLGEQLVNILLTHHLRVIVRPHPQTCHHHPKLLDQLIRLYKDNPLFAYEDNIASQQSLFSSDIMISDWSGAAIDYAFGLEKPVLFIDVPRKVNNPEYAQINIEPFEVSIREQIGDIVTLDQLAEMPTKITTLINCATTIRERIVQLREQSIYNLGCSGRIGGESLIALSKR